jgi:hypothetical protein
MEKTRRQPGGLGMSSTGYQRYNQLKDRIIELKVQIKVLDGKINYLTNQMVDLKD